MKIKTFIFNPLQENTYLVINEDYNQCMVIDAGCLFDAEKRNWHRTLEAMACN
jgi:glyoxylase-like metal-dependent hydrolase (beta-lactamase superfamily II)